jgi:hypothetical protein
MRLGVLAVTLRRLRTKQKVVGVVDEAAGSWQSLAIPECGQDVTVDPREEPPRLSLRRQWFLYHRVQTQ